MIADNGTFGVDLEGLYAQVERLERRVSDLESENYRLQSEARDLEHRIYHLESS